MARNVSHKPTKFTKAGRSRWRVYFAAGEIAAAAKLKEFKTQMEALEFVREFETRHAQLGALASQTTTPELIEAKQASSVLSGSGLSVVEAARMVAAKIESERKSETLRLGFERYMADCERRLKSFKHLRDLNQTRNLFSPLLGELLVNLTGEQIDAILASLPPASRNLKIRHLKAVFNYCIKQDWLTSTPLKRVELAPIRPVHFSPLLRKVRRLGLSMPKDLWTLTVQRGCRHYWQGDEPEGELVSETTLTNEELAIALLNCAGSYSPHSIRCGAAMLGAFGNDPAIVARLAIWERSEAVVRFVAECGRKFEPQNVFWRDVLDRLPECSVLKDGVMPHPTRFVAMSGYERGVGKKITTVWQRPQRSAA